MTSPIDGKIVPFGQVVDKLHDFLHAPEGDVETDDGPLPNLRKLSGQIKEAALEHASDANLEFEDRVYPGVYSTPPTAKPHSGLPPAAGDICMIIVGGVPFEHRFVGGGWVIPNIDATMLALPEGATRIGTADGTLQMVLDGTTKKSALAVSVQDKWLPADGADISPAVARALAESSSIYFPPGMTYRALSNLNVVLSADATIDTGGHLVEFDNAYWRFSGQTVATGRTLAAPAARYATSVMLSDVSGIQAGDLLFLGTSIPVETAWGYTKKDLVEVRAVGSAVELTEPLQFGYSTSDAGLSVSVYRPRRLNILSPNWLLKGVAGQAMCELRWVKPVIDNPVGTGDVASFTPSTNETRRMFQFYGCWHPLVRNLSATALSYPILSVAGTRSTRIDGYKARYCRHAGEATDWVKGFYVWGLRASDCYQAVSSHPAFDVAYEDVVVERDAALSNLRCVGAALRNARIHTLADDASDGPYFHNLATNPGFDNLYADADFVTDNVEIISPNRTAPTIGCDRGREWRVRGLKAVGMRVSVANGIGRIRWGEGNVIAGRDTPTMSPLALRSSAFSTSKNPLLPTYLEGGIYHINPRRELVDQSEKYLRCFGPVAHGLSGAEPRTLSLRIHDHGFTSIESLAAVIGVLRLKATLLHSNSGFFAFQEKTFNFYHKVSEASLLIFPLTAVATTGLSGQANESLQITLSNPSQAGATELGGGADYFVQIDVTLSSARTAPIYSLTYELDLIRPA